MGYKEKSPYNLLTLLDPRYSDLYFSSVEYEKCLDSLTNDAVYDNDIIQSRTVTDDESTDVNSNTQSVDSTDTFSKRRAELLAIKQASSQTRSVGNTVQSFRDRLSEEANKYLLRRGEVDVNVNPNLWWKQNISEFPLLGKFWMANCSFPATSASSERSFNMDGLILTPLRSSLTAERTEKMIVSHDYWLSRENFESYRLCEKCPPPPSSLACYKICCMKHQGKK